MRINHIEVDFGVGTLGFEHVMGTVGKMAYDENLANRNRQVFGERRDIAERKMFAVSRFCAGAECAAASSGAT